MTKWLAVFALLAASLLQGQSYNPLLQPHQTFVDGSGNPCAGCLLYSYIAGTSTPQPTYTSASGAFQNPNPIQLDVAGGATIWTGAMAYKFVLETSLGATIWTVDNVPSGFLSINGGTLNGPLIGTTITASVNSQINVMAPPYSAKGDCATDDSTAIQAAMTAAATYAPPAVVYFPKPPGGCYLTSTLNWNGASLQGQAPVGVIPPVGSSGVVLKGKPSQDILHIADPNLSSAKPANSWSIQNLAFVVDDSVNASSSFPHRWPGRWASDGAMTASSAVLSSPHSEFTCGDVGQNVLVKGAGTSGADLSTTVASVTPCWRSGSPQVVTLTAAASTTVSSARVYTAPANLAVTTTLGNCAIAGDNFDGNSANWLMTGFVGNDGNTIRDVMISSTSGSSHGQNNSCGIYFSGVWQPYGLDARNINIQRVEFGIVEAGADTNPQLGTVGSDYQKWDHGDLQATYPWITYNQGYSKLEDFQFAATYGPQILQVLSASAEVSPSFWYIRNPEMEQTSGGVGWRIESQSPMTIEQTELCAGSNAYIDTTNSDFKQASCTSASLYVNGSGNSVDIKSGLDVLTSVVNGGAGNQVTGIYINSPLNGKESTVKQALLPTRGSRATGTISPDFVANGNVATPYYGNGDLFFWPEDMILLGVNTTPTIDLTSLSGSYLAWPGGAASNFANLNGGAAVIGKFVPAGNVILYLSAKCPSITSFTFGIYANGASVQTGTFTCSTSYSVQSVTANLASYSGQNLGIYVNVTGVNVGWAAVRPFQADYNGQQPVLSSGPLQAVGGGAAVPTGPASATVANDVVIYSNTTGKQADSGVSLSGLLPSNACTSFSSTASSGCMVTPDGKWMQWVASTSESAGFRGSASVSWPVAFPNHLYQVQATITLTAANTTTNWEGQAAYVQPAGTSVSGCSVVTGLTGACVRFDSRSDATPDTGVYAVVFAWGN